MSANQPAEMPTPRSDAAWRYWIANGGVERIGRVCIELERENIALVTALQELVDAEDASIDQFTAVEIDRIEAAMKKARAAIKSATEEKE